MCLGVTLPCTDTLPPATQCETPAPTLIPPATPGPHQQLPALSQRHIGHIVVVVLILRLGAAPCGSRLVGTSPLQRHKSEAHHPFPSSLRPATRADPNFAPTFRSGSDSILFCTHAPHEKKKKKKTRLTYEIQPDVKERPSAPSNDL